MSAASAPAATTTAALTNSDVIAIAAAAVALLAFVATAWQAFLSRQHNRLSVTPSLHIHEIWTSGQPFSLSIVNKGLGPAVIDSISVAMNDHVYDKLDQGFGRAFSETVRAFSEKFKLKVFGPGEVIAAGGSIELFAFPVDVDDDAKLKIAATFLNDFEIKIAYSSMYKQHFRLLHRREKPSRTSSSDA